MGTFRLLDAAPVMTWIVWADAGETPVIVTANPKRAALRNMSIFM
jgi:hypothetical protein